MKFFLFGGGECQEWFLADMLKLARLSSIKLKILADMVARNITGSPLDREKAAAILLDSKLDAEVLLPPILACLHLIFSSATAFHCSASTLSLELQQLGLPREHVQAICRVYNDHNSEISKTFIEKCNKQRTQLDRVSVEKDEDTNTSKLKLVINGEERNLVLPNGMVSDLVKDLEVVKARMEELEGASSHT